MQTKPIFLAACAYACVCACACVRADIENVEFCKETKVDLTIDQSIPIPKDFSVNINKTISQKTEFNVSDIVPDVSEFGTIKLLISRNIIEAIDSDLSNIESASIYLSYIDLDGSEKTKVIGSYSDGNATDSIDLLSNKDIDLAKLSGVKNSYIGFVFTLKNIEAKSIHLKQTMCVNGSAHIEKNFVF